MEPMLLLKLLFGQYLSIYSLVEFGSNNSHLSRGPAVVDWLGRRLPVPEVAGWRLFSLPTAVPLHRRYHRHASLSSALID